MDFTGAKFAALFLKQYFDMIRPSLASSNASWKDLS